MRILHVVAPTEVGGLERVVQALAQGHQRRGHEVHVAAVLDRDRIDHPFFAGFHGSGVGFYRLALGPRRYVRERSLVRNICRRVAPDVVHTHGYRCDVLDAGVARGLGTPTLTTAHGFTGGGRKNRLYEWLQRRAFAKFDAVVAVSEPLARRLESAGVAADRIHVIPNAAAPDGPVLGRWAAAAELGLHPGRFNIGWVGRLSREKGLDVLLDALPALEDVDYDLSVLGDGREAEALREQAEALGVAKRVRWLGVVPNAGRLLRAFDSLVLSSRSEGTPMILLEAMAAGTPIVATRVGGVPDVVDEGEALLVDPDDPAGLAAALRTLQADGVSAARRTEAARQRLARQFDPEPWLDEYEEVYRGLMGRSEAMAGR